jgi:hypothetical protein
MFLEGNRRLKKPIEHVKRGYTETRIGYYRWQSLTEEQRTAIKNLASTLDAKVHFDHEFQFYSITWTTYSWLQARLKEPHITELLNVVMRKIAK